MSKLACVIPAQDQLYAHTKQAVAHDRRLPSLLKRGLPAASSFSWAPWFSSTEQDFQAGGTQGPAADSPKLTKLSLPSSAPRWEGPREICSSEEDRLPQTMPTSSSPPVFLSCNQQMKAVFPEGMEWSISSLALFFKGLLLLLLFLFLGNVSPATQRAAQPLTP